MPLGLGSNLSRAISKPITPGIVTDNLVLKHNYNAGSVIPCSDGAAFFDGSNDYIVADGTSIDFGTNDFTLSLWFHPVGDNTETYFMSQHASMDDRWYFRLDASGKIHFFSKIDGTTAISLTGINAVDANSWNHIVFSVDRDSSTGANMYINGALDKNGNQSSHSSVNYDISTVTPDTAGQEEFNIGRWRNSYSADKYIANVGVWHRALTQAEIKSVMNKNYAGLTDSEKTNLVSWWNLSADANDSHGSNNGTLS